MLAVVILVLCLSSFALPASGAAPCTSATALAHLVSFQSQVTLDGRPASLGTPICADAVLRRGPAKPGGSQASGW